MKNAVLGDELSRQFYNALCFEIEAAGVVDQTRCLVIRGRTDPA